jgi:hypothetical protein
MKLSEEEILRIQPFNVQIGNIDAAESLKGPWAISGNSFKITAAGRNYKLRCCDSEAAAEHIKDNIKKLPKYFPKFISQEGQFVLFDWIDGNILENHTIQDCYFIGKMMGEAHELGLIAENINPHSFFNSRIETLRTVFSEEIIEKIMSKYAQLTEKLKLDVVLEFSDVHQRNFIKNKNGEIYYVDEEGFDYKIKGLGIAKPLFTQAWIKTQEEKDAFWKGYNEHHSSDYFDKDYEKFICFVQLLRTITVRVKSGGNYSREVSEILDMLKD